MRQKVDVDSKEDVLQIWHFGLPQKVRIRFYFYVASTHTTSFELA